MEQTRVAVTGVRAEREKGRHPSAPLTLARFTVLLVIATLAIEALLVFRAWVQLSGWQLDVGVLQAMYDLSAILVSPFRGLEAATVSARDVLQLATVVAFEAYLVLAVVTFGLALLVRRAAKLISVRFEHDGVVLSPKAEQQAA